MIIKPVIGFEEKYTIDEYGNVFNIFINRYMKPYISNKGYKCIDLNYKEKSEKWLVHRLVAVHFIPNPYNYPIVLHLDNNKLNTHYTNLKWGTYSENNSQAIRDGLNIVPRPDNRKVVIISKDKECIYPINYCHGISEAIELTEYKGTRSGFSNYIFRHTPLKDGPYKNMYICRTSLTPCLIFEYD